MERCTSPWQMEGKEKEKIGKNILRICQNTEQAAFLISPHSLSLTLSSSSLSIHLILNFYPTLPPSILVLPSLPLHLSLSISLSSSLFFEPHVDAEQFLELLNRIAVWWRHTAILCKKTMLRGWDSESKIHDPSQRPDIECDHWHNRTVRYALLVCAFCCEWTADSEVDLEPWIQYPGLRCVWVLRTEWGAWGAERSYIATVTTWSDGIAIAMVNLIRRDRDRDRDRGDCRGSISASVCLCPCLSTLLYSALLGCTVLCRAVQCVLDCIQCLSVLDTLNLSLRVPAEFW